MDSCGKLLSAPEWRDEASAGRKPRGRSRGTSSHGEESLMVAQVSSDHCVRPGYAVCPDCPMPRAEALESGIPPQVSVCTFRCVTLAARAPIPPEWFKAYGLGVVRRGILIRQRVDAHGHATAVDAVGAAGVIPLSIASHAGEESNMSGFAVSDVLLCAWPSTTMRASMEADADTSRDLLKLQGHALRRMERLVDARGRSTVVERVAALLCALSDTLSPARHTDVIPLELQQIDLAALVSARQETVCRALGTLQKRGLIARTPDGTRIANRRALESL
jgi:hypothetical protein